jgi:two-component system chemotaxis response regulator CheY
MPGEKMRALIVDDSRFVRNFIAGLLQTMQIDSAQAADGRQALQVLAADPQFDLALVNINMPVMNGFELLKAMREESHFNSIKVMIVSSNADKTIVSNAVKLGANQFLMKPFAETHLREKLVSMGILQKPPQPVVPAPVPVLVT